MAQNWQEFAEQLHWLLAGTQSGNKSDTIKIGIMLTHARKEGGKIYETFHWDEEGDAIKFDKVIK